MTHDRTRELGTKPIGQLLMQYAVPAIIAMTASSLYNMVDSVFIGQGVGAMAIAGLAIIFPLMTSMGFDPYAILVFLVIMINLGSISPPIGMGVFVSAQAVNVDPKIIFKGIWPYCLVTIACAYVIAFVPQIINFLPNLLA